MRRTFVPIVLALVCVAPAWSPALGGGTASAASPAPGGAFDPASTDVVVAGVLEWKDPSLPPFSKDHRKDQELYDVLAARGVPESQRVLLLDNDATADNIYAAIDRLAARAPAGSTFIFYFAGHGAELADGQIVLCSADVENGRFDRTGVHIDDLPAHFAGFHGQRVVFLADCCHSGGLAAAARALAGHGLETLALTSAEASNTSTGNWTFTQNVIDALRGAQIADRDGNGAISLADLHAEIKVAMKMRERQRCGWADFGVPESWSLAKVTPDPNASQPGSGAWRRGNWVLADGTSGREPARILRVDGNQLYLSFYHYSVEVDAWVPAAQTSPVPFTSYPAGTAVDVQWRGKWYPAKVTRVEDDFDFIAYDGMDRHWDEWVTNDRMRLASAEAEVPSTSLAGKKVKVEWKGQWYEAEIMSESAGSYCIHYSGYEAKCDECVPGSRVQGL